MQAVNQMVDVFTFAADLNFNASGVVPHPAGQFKLLGQSPHKRAETDALNDAAKPNALTDNVRIFKNLHASMSPKINLK